MWLKRARAHYPRGPAGNGKDDDCEGTGAAAPSGSHSHRFDRASAARGIGGAAERQGVSRRISACRGQPQTRAHCHCRFGQSRGPHWRRLDGRGEAGRHRKRSRSSSSVQTRTPTAIASSRECPTFRDCRCRRGKRSSRANITSGIASGSSSTQLTGRFKTSWRSFERPWPSWRLRRTHRPGRTKDQGRTKNQGRQDQGRRYNVARIPSTTSSCSGVTVRRSNTTRSS